MDDMTRLKTALAESPGDNDSLDRFVAVATEELGPDWATTIYDRMTDLTVPERERLDHAYQYYAALAAWNEAQSYLTDESVLDVEQITDRLPILEHWLAFFQEAGLDIVRQLRDRLEQDRSRLETKDVAPARTADETIPQEADTAPVATPDPVPAKPWILEKIERQMTMTQEVQAWVSARCVALGNKEVFSYPHYGFVVDLMKQTRDDIQSLLASSEALAEVGPEHADDIKQIQDYQLSLERDLEVAAQNGLSEETDLISDDLTGADARRLLGQLDTSNTPEYSGPAPDGFEPILDSDSDLDEQPIKEEYKHIENVVLSDNNDPIPTGVIKNKDESEKNTSQTPQNGVKKKLSFSLGPKKPSAT